MIDLDERLESARRSVVEQVLDVQPPPIHALRRRARTKTAVRVGALAICSAVGVGFAAVRLARDTGPAGGPISSQVTVGPAGAPAPLSVLDLIRSTGTADVAGFGWSPSPRLQILSAVVARRNDLGTAVVATTDVDRQVCLALVLRDWQPTTCNSIDAVEAGRFVITAQASPSSPRVIGVLVPDNAHVVIDGVVHEPVNNVWFGEVAETQRVQIQSAEGDGPA